MKFRSTVLIVALLGLAACSKTSTAENSSTTNEIVTNEGSDVLNASGNASDLDAGNADGNAAGNAL